LVFAFAVASVVAGPPNAKFLGRWEGETVSVLAGSGDYLYVDQMPTIVLNVSNPKEPKGIGEYWTGGLMMDTEAFVIGDILLTANTMFVFAMDISDPSQPSELGSFHIEAKGSYNPMKPVGAVGICAEGNYAYVAALCGGLIVVDISDPSDMKEIGRCETRNVAKKIAKSGDYVFIADRASGLGTFDISDPENPKEISYLELRHDARGIDISGDKAYVADRDGGLAIVDISNPKHPKELGHLATEEPAWNVRVVGNYAFLANAGDGLMIVDVLDPENPKKLKSFATEDFAEDVWIIGTRLYVSESSAGVSIYDISEFMK